jgi:hypothetical protein
MSFCRPPLSRVVVASLALAAVRLAAEINSPFLPPPGQAVAATTATAPLELRGVNSIGDTLMFSIFDPTKKTGTWVKLNEPGYDFSVKKYDPETDTVTIDYQGRSHSLTMRTAKIASSGNAIAPPPPVAPMAPAIAANTPPNPVTRNVVVNPTNATEAARLADWQAEIQRRRDMRAAAANQPGATAAQPAQPAPAPVVQPQVEQARPQTNQGNNQQRQRNPQRQRGQ